MKLRFTDVTPLKNKILKAHSFKVLTHLRPKKKITKFEELASVGSRLLVGFQQQLELLRRPPLNKTSEVVDDKIKANQSDWVNAYVEAGCTNVHDGVQNIIKLNACQQGLQDLLSKAKGLLNELECLMEDVIGVMRIEHENLECCWDKHSGAVLVHEAEKFENDEMKVGHIQKTDFSDYASMMGILYSMLKQDYTMQEKIVSSLKLSSLSGELESYCLMWSLRPFINDEILHQAWRFIP